MTARVAPGGTRTSASSLRQSKLPPHSNARTPVSVPATGRPKSSTKKKSAAAPPPPRKPWARANSEISSEPRPSTGSDESCKHPRARSHQLDRRPRPWPGNIRWASLLTIQYAGAGSPSSKSPLTIRFVAGCSPTGICSTVSPSISRMPLAPISPTDMMASRVPGGTGIRLTTRVQRVPTVWVHGPSVPLERCAERVAQEIDQQGGLFAGASPYWI